MHTTLLVLILFLHTACVAIGTKVTEGQLARFTRGQTTYSEVYAALGAPNQSTLHADGSRDIHYVYSQSQVRVENFIPLLAALKQGSTAEHTQVSLTFDPHGVLRSYTATQGTQTVGTGLASGAKQ